MTSLQNHQSNKFTKLLIEGDSKSGKTGSLASLVSAGYWLGILDFDNGLDVLRQYVLRDSPDAIHNVEFRTLRDPRSASTEGPKIDGKPKAFVTAYKMIDHWKYKEEDGTEIDYGRPDSWGPNKILVIDSLTFMSDSALDHHEAIMPQSTKSGGQFDGRASFYSAQKAIEDVLAHICGPNFETNVIVISHIKYMEIGADKKIKGFPVSVGRALSPLIPRYFNSVIRYETKSGGKRQIKTQADSTFDLANPKPFEMGETLEIEDGLAEFFKTLRPAPETETKSKPKPRRT